MTWSQFLEQAIQLLVGGITGVASGIGQGLNSAVTEMFLTTDATTHAVNGLSTFGGLTAVFGGIALAVGLTTLVFHWVSSIGK